MRKSSTNTCRSQGFGTHLKTGALDQRAIKLTGDFSHRCAQRGCNGRSCLRDAALLASFWLKLLCLMLRMITQAVICPFFFRPSCALNVVCCPRLSVYCLWSKGALCIFCVFCQVLFELKTSQAPKKEEIRQMCKNTVFVIVISYFKMGEWSEQTKDGFVTQFDVEILDR